MADWASLPADLIILISDTFLATEDLDYYMDFRAVCSSWRSATDDPMADPRDPRFRPRRWAMLDEVHQSDARLFVNVDTGRFVRKDLPLLSSRYYLVASVAGSLIVLAEKTGGHAALVLNPFTCSMIRVKAPVPPEVEFTAHMIGSSSPTLVLVSGYRSMYWADAEDENFHIHNAEHINHPFVRMALAGGIYAAARELGSLASLLTPATYDILDLLSNPFPDWSSGTGELAVSRCFLVESQGEMLVVVKLRHGPMNVFRIDTVANMIEPVKDIGSRALFVGDCRCLSIDADKFASTDANCIYYVDQAELTYDICIYSLKDKIESFSSSAVTHTFQISKYQLAYYVSVSYLWHYI
ncbi:hypothetical protein PR202_ga15303 [Eleusine coracana subsp. coracana]|uniref:KIB1-4 beta-propeller domain-containing protein n=1 Tax=Eleusine coracana subsp. coracana TaxID=191504 RepID=A0AAV5CJP4_ELECO|nr:hypothetical protein PR202_ga15303 [Eleusine coracana subsp. coracana]